MLPALHSLAFRVHTRVLLTLVVGVLIATTLLLKAPDRPGQASARYAGQPDATSHAS